MTSLIERTTLLAASIEQRALSKSAYAERTAALPSTLSTVPATSVRAASVFSDVTSAFTAVTPYSAVSRCLFMMNSVFAVVGTDAGSVPAAIEFGLPPMKVGAGQLDGTTGGAVSLPRSTYGELLDEPL